MNKNVELLGTPERVHECLLPWKTRKGESNNWSTVLVTLSNII